MKEEIEKFSRILADSRNNYTASLEKLALKKLSNNELFEHINNNNNWKKLHQRCPSHIPHKTLDTSIERLRNKYKDLKQEWSKIITSIKSGIGLSPEKEPVWFKNRDPVFCETDDEMNWTCSAAETSLNEQDGEAEEERNGEENIFSGADNMVKTKSWKVKQKQATN